MRENKSLSKLHIPRSIKRISHQTWEKVIWVTKRILRIGQSKEAPRKHVRSVSRKDLMDRRESVRSEPTVKSPHWISSDESIERQFSPLVLDSTEEDHAASVELLHSGNMASYTYTHQPGLLGVPLVKTRSGADSSFYSNVASIWDDMAYVTVPIYGAKTNE